MKKLLSLTIIIVFLFGCGPKKVVESKYENGSPKVVKYYKKLQGKEQLVREVVFYENKSRKMDGQYSNNLRSGHWIAWYEDGKIWSEGDYKDGKRNGPGLVYHENGKIYIESMYADDAKTGKWKFYDTSGVIVKEVDFDLISGKQSADTLRQPAAKPIK